MNFLDILQALLINWAIGELVVVAIDNKEQTLRRYLLRCPVFALYFVLLQFWPLLLAYYLYHFIIRRAHD